MKTVGVKGACVSNKVILASELSRIPLLLTSALSSLSAAAIIKDADAVFISVGSVSFKSLTKAVKRD